jgi:hypothetical protein
MHKIPRFLALSSLLLVILVLGAVAAESTLKHPLARMPASPNAAEDITATCEISDLDGDVYKAARIIATNNVDHLMKCDFNCSINRKVGMPYKMTCHLDIPGGQTSF